MLPSLFLKGWLIGFSIAMPVGPIGMLCIRHALIQGMTYGLASGIGAALADAVYGALAGYGVTAVSGFLTQYELWLQAFGAFFLFYLGLATLKKKPVENNASLQAGHLKVCFYTFILTVTNPMTMFCFAGIYAGCGLGASCEGHMSPLILTLGVFIGSTVWWIILSSGIALLGRRFSFQSFSLFNKISGIALLAFAFLAAFSAMRGIHFC